MEGISLELKVLSCRDLKTSNFFQKLSVYAAVSISIVEAKKDEPQQQKSPLDIFVSVLKKNEKHQQRPQQRRKAALDNFHDEPKKNEQQQQQKTPIDKGGGCNPEWNHVMHFDLTNISLSDHGDHHYNLKFELRCEGAIFGNKTIGEVHVPFKDLIDEFAGTVRFLSYQVRNSDGKPNGVLNFSYKVNGKVKKCGTDNYPKVDLSAGIHFSPKKVHYPSLEVDVQSKETSLYPSLDDIRSPSLGKGAPDCREFYYPAMACYTVTTPSSPPPPPIPLLITQSPAIGHGVYYHPYPSPLTQTPGPYWYTAKTADYSCGLRGYSGGWAVN